MAALGLISTDICPLCGSIPKSNSHLFFAFIYSLQCLRDILTWLDIRIVSDSLADFASQKWQCAIDKRKSATIGLCSLTYEIWCVWNDSIWNFKVPTISRITRQVKLAVMSRVLHIPIKSINIQRPWIRNLLDYK